MKPKKPNMRVTRISAISELSPHLRRIVVSGDSLQGFPTGQEGGYVKVIIQPLNDGDIKMRSYTIRSFNAQTNELVLDFVVNRHQGPVTDWALAANVGDSLGIAGPGPMKLTNYEHSSYLLVGDLTSINAINGYVPRFNASAMVKAIIAVPTRADIIAMDYDDSANTTWFVEDENTQTLAEYIVLTAQDMPKNTHVFMGVEAGVIRTLRPILQEQLGFERLNIFAVGYWKKGLDADRFGAQKKLSPL